MDLHQPLCADIRLPQGPVNTQRCAIRPPQCLHVLITTVAHPCMCNTRSMRRRGCRRSISNVATRIDTGRTAQPPHHEAPVHGSCTTNARAHALPLTSHQHASTPVLNTVTSAHTSPLSPGRWSLARVAQTGSQKLLNSKRPHLVWTVAPIIPRSTCSAMSCTAQACARQTSDQARPCVHSFQTPAAAGKPQRTS